MYITYCIYIKSRLNEYFLYFKGLPIRLLYLIVNTHFNFEYNLVEHNL